MKTLFDKSPDEFMADDTEKCVNTLFKVAKRSLLAIALAWIMWALIFLTFLSGVIWVAVHFIHKYW